MDTMNFYIREPKASLPENVPENSILCRVEDKEITYVGVIKEGTDPDKYALSKLSREHYDEFIRDRKSYKVHSRLKNKNVIVASVLSKMQSEFYDDEELDESNTCDLIRIVEEKYKDKNVDKNIVYGSSFSDFVIEGGEQEESDEEKDDDKSDENEESDKQNENVDASGQKRKESSSSENTEDEESDSDEDKRNNKKIRLSNTTDNGFEKELFESMILFDDATDYDGFNSKSIRATFLNQCKDKNTFVRMILKSILVYVKAGNNTTKLMSKRKDTNKARELLDSISSLGIKRTASSKDSLTFPRIAIAFMSELFLVRSLFIKNLQQQVSSNLDLKFQDVAFCGCGVINKKTGYDQFYLEFSRLIANNGNGYSDGKEGEDASVKDSERWKRIAVMGYNSDKMVQDRIQGALEINSPSDAMEFIGKSYELYVKERSGL